jgi:hypothetical protein
MSPCSTPSGTGSCISTSACSASGGKSFAGYCTGPSNLQCCVTDLSPDDDISTTSTLGYDIADALSATHASCFDSSGYSFAIPRGFRSTGAVDTNVCPSVTAAYNAGAKVVDTYMFPCKNLRCRHHGELKCPLLIRSYMLSKRCISNGFSRHPFKY